MTRNSVGRLVFLRPLPSPPRKNPYISAISRIPPHYSRGLEARATTQAGCLSYTPSRKRHSSPEKRRSVWWFRTAMASAFFCPMSTTRRLPRVTPV